MSAETSEQSFAGEQQLTAEGDGLSMPFAVRPVSIRPDGLSGAGMHFAEASLASTTGPLFSADDLPEGQILRPAQAIKGLYAAFNARDAACVASFLTDDCVYEDLLLGPYTVCRGRQAFCDALKDALGYEMDLSNTQGFNDAKAFYYVHCSAPNVGFAGDGGRE